MLNDKTLDYDNPPFKVGDIVRRTDWSSVPPVFQVDRVAIHNDTFGVDSWIVHGKHQDGTETGAMADVLEHVDAVTRLGWVHED